MRAPRGGAAPAADRPALTALAGRVVPKSIAGFFAALALAGVVEVAAGLRSGASDAFYPDLKALLLAGRLSVEGRLDDAYSWPAMSALERADGIAPDSFLPFAYPPPFALWMSGLSGLPPWVAYPAFDLAGLVLFLAALARLSSGRFWPLAAAAAPACYVGAIAGQNGALLAAVAGLSAALTLHGRSVAGGATAGLLGATKPQVAVALPLLFAARRDWRAAVAASALALTALGVSAAVLGPHSLTAWLRGLSDTSRALAVGRFPLHRMVSTYAFLRSFGAPPQVALALHSAVAALVLGCVAAAARRTADARAVAGLALMPTAFVSPYFYDYDTPIVAVGLALALPALDRAGGGWRVVAPLACLGVAGYAGFALPEGAPRLSLGAPLLLVGLAVTLAALRGAPARTADALPI